MDQPIRIEWRHRLCFSSDALSVNHDTLARYITRDHDGGRALVVIDRGLADAQPGIADAVQAYFHAHADRLPKLVGVETINGGEVCKNDPRVLNDLLVRMDECGIDRWSVLVSIGGGALLDVAGFAAATFHRGVRTVRLPTTTLAQADSGVGVKCGVNHRGKKNLLGAFAVPQAVVCDPTLCRTLDDTDWRCGFAEAVKVALIKEAALFAQLQRDAAAINARDEEASFPVIERSAELHFRHITAGGDPFETGAARPLDMGHWAAHKLEQMTDFNLRHGQAVAIGLAVDLTYAAGVGLMGAADADAAIDLLGRLGFELSHPAMNDAEALLVGLDEFREHLGGPLTLVMPAGIGSTISVNQIDRSAMLEAVRVVQSGR